MWLSSASSWQVRDMAATTLSGLLQCQFFPLDFELQERLQTLSQTRLPRARGELASSGTHTHRWSQEHTASLLLCVRADLVRRHAGVLGLGACILSSPYDVPDWMPQILMELSDHLNDPQPIEVRKHRCYCPEQVSSVRGSSAGTDPQAWSHESL